ncbi:hypothetical protein [Kaarinaea lacus]
MKNLIDEYQKVINKDIHPERPPPHLEGVIYGDIIYWVTILASVLVLVGSMITFVTGNDYIDPNYLLSSVWEGKSVDDIWIGAVGAPPDGHWYLSVLTTGNGMTMGGIALGVFSVLPAIVVSGIVLYNKKEYLYAILAAIAAIVTGVAVVL